LDKREHPQYGEGEAMQICPRCRKPIPDGYFKDDHGHCASCVGILKHGGLVLCAHCASCSAPLADDITDGNPPDQRRKVCEDCSTKIKQDAEKWKLPAFGRVLEIPHSGANGVLVAGHHKFHFDCPSLPCSDAISSGQHVTFKLENPPGTRYPIAEIKRVRYE